MAEARIMPTPKLPHIEDYEALGAGLRKLRETAAMTQEQAGAAIDLRAQTISEVERAERGPSWHTLRGLLRVYGATLSDLDDAIEWQRRR